MIFLLGFWGSHQSPFRSGVSDSRIRARVWDLEFWVLGCIVRRLGSGAFTIYQLT